MDKLQSGGVNVCSGCFSLSKRCSLREYIHEWQHSRRTWYDMKGSHTIATCFTPGNPHPCPLCSSAPHMPQQPLMATSPRRERF